MLQIITSLGRGNHTMKGKVILVAFVLLVTLVAIKHTALAKGEPDLDGSWNTYDASGKQTGTTASIQENCGKLDLTNENSQSAKGSLKNDGENWKINITSGWPDANFIVGTVINNGTRIDWSNRKNGQPGGYWEKRS